MNIRIMAVDKLRELSSEDKYEIDIYVIHAEAQWLDEYGREQVVEFQTHLTEDELNEHSTEWRRAVTERAYSVLEEEAFAHSLVGQEWTVPDRKASGKVMSA